MGRIDRWHSKRAIYKKESRRLIEITYEAVNGNEE